MTMTSHPFGLKKYRVTVMTTMEIVVIMIMMTSTVSSHLFGLG